MKRPVSTVMQAARPAVFLAILIIGGWGCGEPKAAAETPAEKFARIGEIVLPPEEIEARLEEKAKEALAFCDSSGYNTDFCILIDMKIHSGKYRMFVYDFNKQEVERQALCAHGCGKDDMKSTGGEPLFGNVEGSLLTSLGKYKTGIRSPSQWGIGIHYKLHGLEAGNSNAFKRIIVLHSYSPLSSGEIYPSHIPMGWSAGCPVTDDETMAYLDVKLQNSKKPVLLWIYY